MVKRDEHQAAILRKRRVREAENLFSRLPATYAASRKQGQNILRRSGGLSIVEWRTVWDLSEAGPLTIRELAEIQRADHSLLSRALPEMRKKGLVTMRQDEDDKRQTIVELTDLGKAAYERAAPPMKRRRDAMRALFSDDELRDFVNYLDRLEVFLRHPIDDLFENEEMSK